MLLVLGGGLLVYAVTCAFVHRYVLHTGEAVTRTETYTDGSGHHKEICYKAVGGDFGTAVVAHEIFGAEVYMNNGIHVPLAGSPLVIDIGCNIGLFSMFVMERNPQALIVGAEPIPRLCALARQNTARYGQRVYVEEVGVSASPQAQAIFTVDPRISAGASMFEADITRPWKATSICLQLSIVLSDNVRAKSLPAQPTLWLSSVLRVPVLQWVVLALLTPPLLLFVLFLLTAPSQRAKVKCTCVPFAELLDRAASHMDDHALQRHLREAPISLVKVDVEGAEWEVLRGITAQEWQRIEQIVVEVHDVEDRVRKVEALLKANGFADVQTTQEEWDSHEVLRIRSVFARRCAATASAAS